MIKLTIKYENPLEMHMKSRERLIKAMRKVKSNGRTTTGQYPSKLNGFSIQFESGLESDFVAMLEFDKNVAKYYEQPVKINYTFENKSRTYVPDFLVYFKNLDGSPTSEKPVLYEVKTRSDIKKNWQKLKPKFLAAMRYCDAKGWKFKIKTEKEIATDYSKNAKFLLPFMRKTPDYVHIETLQHAIHELKTCTASELISHYSKNMMRQAELVHALWYLVGNRDIKCDLTKKLTMASIVSIP